ncbi:hypothetical protein ACN4EK_31690 [Pantanalinema rosaneae CENA516]|uniref:hypothetical protein n=1 Tax=Pantanalinema rosaneae TaxID=1620701 RepID=UPI003D6F0797
MNTQDPSRKPRNKNPNHRAYKFAEILTSDQDGRQAVLTQKAAKQMFKRKVRARVSGDKNWLSSKDLDRAVAASERDDKKAARRFKKQQLEQDLELAKQLRRRIKTAKPKKEKVLQRQSKGAQLISPGRHSVLPNYGYAIRDRQGRIGVHPKFKYISSKTSKPGAARRAVQYYARGVEIDANGLPMVYSNVARSVQEAATCFDHIEMINRSAQKNAKVAMTGIMPMDPRWTPSR